MPITAHAEAVSVARVRFGGWILHRIKVIAARRVKLLFFYFGLARLHLFVEGVGVVFLRGLPTEEIAGLCEAQDPVFQN